MELENTFEIPVPIDDAWKVLLDIERVAPCMPGATLETVEGDEFTGKVKVKVGPITVTYRGSARFVERDDATYRSVIEASGKEARGPGTARATVAAQLTAKGDATEVRVHTDLTVTGRPAQFGRGVMADVAEKLLGRFADCLAGELQGPAAAVPAAAATATTAQPGAGGAVPVTADPATAGAASALQGEAPSGQRAAPPPVPEAEAIDLFDIAGVPLAKRLAPVAGVVLLAALVAWWLRRRSA